MEKVSIALAIMASASKSVISGGNLSPYGYYTPRRNNGFKRNQRAQRKAKNCKVTAACRQQ